MSDHVDQTDFDGLHLQVGMAEVLEWILKEMDWGELVG